MEKLKKKLVLANGEIFIGEGFGANVEAIGEIIFNTSMAGYQEIVSDPSYASQMIVMSYPIIGNYGITDDDYESKSLALNALIVRDYNDSPSNFRYTSTLSELLEENDVPGLHGIDTRKLVRILRDKGTMVACLANIDTSDEECLKRIKEYIVPKDLMKKAGCKKKIYSRTANHKYNVAVVDCGIKHHFIKNLNNLGCNVTLVPYNTTYEEIMELESDAVVLSNGPGSANDFDEIVNLVKELKGKLPIMGFCVGAHFIARAYGGTIKKMKFGNHGSNHAVICQRTGKVEVVGHNNGHYIVEDSLKGTDLKITYRSALDGTVEGIEDEVNSVFGVQFIPEIADGPEGSERIYSKLIRSMEKK